MASAPASSDASEGDPAPPPGFITVAEPEHALAPPPRRSGWQTLWRGARFGLLCSVPIGALMVFDELFLVGFAPWFGLPLVFGLLLTMMIAVFTAPLLLFSATRRGTLPAFGCASTFAIVSIGALFLHNDARMIAFARVARDAEPLVAALHEFTAREGHPPAALDELVPEYIARVPSASLEMGDFNYRRHEDSLPPHDVDAAQPVDPVPWSLLLHCGRGMFNWDVFVYWPGEQYPTDMYGGSVERVGRWAYVHE